MCVWVPMVAWGVVKLLRALIDWRARVSYERARATSVVEVLRAARAGATVQENRADGTELRIHIPARQDLCRHGAHAATAGQRC
jgi:hypothetical protein